MRIHSKKTDPNESVIVFDIGGTWFRSAVLSGNVVRFKFKKEAINFKNYPEKTIEELHNGLVEYFIDNTNRLKEKAGINGEVTVGISMGAAMNGRTGEILNSGPIWGKKSKPFNLLEALDQKQKDTNWVVLNDVTAGLIRHVSGLSKGNYSRIMLITVSTGIAARTYDNKTNEIPLTQEHGLQGEIGHIPVHFTFRDRTIELFCDCGGKNHLNAFSSGRGIESVLNTLANLNKGEYSTSLLSQTNFKTSFENFIIAIEKKDKFALEVLNSVTFPLAQILVNAFTIDASIDIVLLTGGVVHSLKDNYAESLLDNLSKIGFYQITNKDPDFFKKRIKTVPDDDAGLIGAGHFARLQPLKIHKKNEPLVWNISASQAIEYTIFEESDLFSYKNSFLYDRLHLEHSIDEAVVIVDLNVYELLNEKMTEYFQFYGITAHIIPMSVSEGNKAIDNVLSIERELDRYKVKRRDPLIGVGGGVLLDIVGLAASLYRRGIPYIRVPTTLLGLVDAGIGIKTAINFNANKNRLGTYYAATETYLDKTFLQTLDERNICNGLAEILKIAIIKDAELFYLLETHAESLIESKFQNDGISDMVISRSVTGMLEELEPNLWEHNLERLVDFGHTFSPAIEIASIPNLLHGEAVAIDMIICSIISTQRGLLPQTDCQRIIDLTRKLRLPLFHKVCKQALIIKGLQDITTHRGGLQRMPTPISIGKAIFINDVTHKEVASTLKVVKDLAKD